MKAFKHIPSLLMLSIVASMTAFPVLTAVGLFVLSLFSGGGQQGLTMNGVVKETWRPYIVERFWKDNAFLQGKFVDESDAVVAGRIVHIPQPGSKPTVVKNRSSFPATAVRRTDTDITYTLDEYTTDPTHIPNIDSVHLSYSKQDSVLGDHVMTLNETVADDILIKWASSSNVSQVATTGGAAVTQVAPATGQTGNRLAFHHTDLQKLMTRMNTDKVPKADRYILMDDYMYDGFYNSLSDTQSKDFSRYVDAENGIIGRLHGFNIMTRSSVLAVTNANAIKALGSAIAATDNLCSLAWQKNSVAMAMGDVMLFENTKDALYYGDVYSTLTMCGGRARREDGLGIYIVRQGVPA